MVDDDFTGDTNGSESAALPEAPAEATPAPVPAPVAASAATADTELEHEAPGPHETQSEADSRSRDDQGRFAKQARDSREDATIPSGPDTVPTETAAPEKVSKTQERINKAVFAQRQAEREAQYWRQQAEQRAATRSEAGSAGSLSAVSPGAPGEAEPVFEQFQQEADPWLAYNKALSRWAAREAILEAQTQQQSLAQQQQQQSRITKHQHDMQALRAVTPEYDSLIEVANATPVSPELSAAILESDLSARLVLHLAQHSDTFDELRSLTGVSLYRALGRVESRLEAAPGGSASPAPLSRANAPIKPLGTSPVVVDSPPTDADSDDAHFAYWNRKEQEARRRR